MGWLRKHGGKLRRKLKKFFKTKAGKAVGLIALGFILPQAWAWLTKSTMPQWGSWYGIGGPRGFLGSGLGKTSSMSAAKQELLKETVLDSSLLKPVKQPVEKSVPAVQVKVPTEIIDTAKNIPVKTAQDIHKISSQGVAAGSNNIIANNVTDAVVETIDYAEAAKNYTIEQLSTPGFDITTGTVRPRPASTISSSTDLAEIVDVERAKEAVQAVQTGTIEKGYKSALPKLTPPEMSGIARFGKDVGVGVVTAGLTSVLLDKGEQDEAIALGVQPSPTPVGPANTYVSDVTNQYAMRTGTPQMTFDMFLRNQFPMYGPLAKQNIGFS